MVFFFLGNELYLVEMLSELTKSPSILSLFVYSPARNQSSKNLISAFLGSCLDSFSNLANDLIPYIRNFRTGLEVLHRLNTNQFLYHKIHEIPQGYSSAFTLQLVRKVQNINHKGSLLKALQVIDDFTGSQEILYDVSFVGQQGNCRRESFLRVFQSRPKINSMIVTRDEFGGNNKLVDDTYINASLGSRIVLIPPGAFNNYNHRYCESLILNRLPLVVCNNNTDPNSNYYWVRELPFGLRDSASFIYNHIKNWEPEEIKNKIQVAREIEFSRIESFVDTVFQYVNQI